MMAATFTLESCYRTAPDQLCWDCANACGGCEWSRSFQPVPGWTAAPARRIQNYGETGFKVIDTYRITACPKFTKEAAP
nr:MAG TPA: hypothetical protein [Caudoviricetes sp.]